MQQWWQQHWGNVASAVGLVVSLLAWWKATSAVRAVKRFRRHRTLTELIRLCRSALVAIEQMQDSTGAILPEQLRNKLHDTLSSARVSSVLNTQDRMTLLRHCVSLRDRLDNQPSVQNRLYRMVEDLRKIVAQAQNDLEDLI